MQGADLFAAELRDLGFEVAREGAFVSFDYSIEAGAHSGRVVRVALKADAHPHSPPSGPFVSPRLLPIRPDSTPAPLGGVHEASGRDGFADPAGAWQYWSRPYNEWLQHGRSAKAYVEIHLRRLFAGLPEELELPWAA